MAGTVATASASTVPDGQVQICAQGDYAAYVDIHPVELGGGMTSPGFMSTVQKPGSCWQSKVNTSGATAPVDVWGIRADGSKFHVGASSFNSKTGLGLGAQGTAAAPSMAQW
ncbi:hypothetical protein OOZ19_14675 [Saccharopolyspora sp. NFXS83]|uniref:hypothetical protein n=1 Tax=Saccharopolyspora sp. NFXS83 TaxID=2993560 RepID=UPI00224B4148|nr:hypothetical protein [Saccharopolyspora sp. NFXS83]MCX2731487.1 hypothetical protein [Saccharopolyspora sp. NFXS83]